MTAPWSWPEEATPPSERMSDWLRLALTVTRRLDPSERNRVYKARVVARKALAIARGDMAYALSIAQLAEAEVHRLARGTAADPSAAKTAVTRAANGDIGHGKLTALVAAGLTESSVAAATVPAWPLPEAVPGEIRRDTRWHELEPARRASGLSSADFAARHGLPATYVRKCTMLMMAARRLAGGSARRARRILAMSHAAILTGDKAVRSGTPEGQALIARLDRKEAPNA